MTDQPQPQPATPEEPKPRKPWWRRWWAIALGIFVIIVIIAAIAGGEDDDDSDSSSPASSTTATTATTGTTTTTAASTATTTTTTNEAAPPATGDPSATFSQAMKDNYDGTRWWPVVTGTRIDGSNAYVTAQLDRQNQADKAVAELIARSAKNLVSTTDSLSDVKWVIVEDGAGVVITQTQVG